MVGPLFLFAVHFGWPVPPISRRKRGGVVAWWRGGVVAWGRGGGGWVGEGNECVSEVEVEDVGAGDRVEAHALEVLAVGVGRAVTADGLDAVAAEHVGATAEQPMPQP